MFSGQRYPGGCGVDGLPHQQPVVRASSPHGPLERPGRRLEGRENRADAADGAGCHGTGGD